MKFKIDKNVFDKFPDLVVAIPIIYGFDNNKSKTESEKILRDAEDNLRNKFTLESLIADNRARKYMDCFVKFGCDPDIFTPAHIALSKRVIENGQIPSINPMVNLYNAFSITNMTPFGGEDLDKVCGDFKLFFAEGGEKWYPIGSKKSKPAVEGELVWGDELNLSTRSLNWRQCERTKLTSNSKNGYFVMDGFRGVNDDLIKKAANEFLKQATEMFGGESEILWLDAKNMEVEISFVSKSKKDFEVIKVERKKNKKVEMGIAGEIKKMLLEVLGANNSSEFSVDHPANTQFGDYSTNVAMILSKVEKKNPNEIAKGIASLIKPSDIIEKVEVVGGFINFYLKKNVLKEGAEKINYEIEFKNKVGEFLKNKKIMVEFAHPNTHKELHIGHMRTLITGESLARVLEFVGANVFRANYQGDIGPHVAKAIWGTRKLLSQSNKSFKDWDKESFGEKSHFLGKGYALGCAEYEDNKDEIDKLNQSLYEKELSVMSDYQLTRQWSLDYYNEFYERFGTRFDKLFFESEIANKGKEIVESLVGTILEKSEGAIVFDGEKYGLHKRVFETALGTPTYEGKELGLAYAQREVFEFDKNIHVVANEQAGYFQVVIKAIELMDEWFKDREHHLSMGMVTLVGRKMSSRTGDVVTVDSVLDEVKESIRPFIKTEGMTKDAIEEIAEVSTIGAVKFSILKSDPMSNSIFDIKKSVDIEGDSGPYLQYTYARCQSVLGKTKILEQKNIEEIPENINDEEMALLREFYKFEEKIIEAAERYNPAVIAEFLLTIARKYNEFYAKHRVIGEKEEVWRIFLTKTTASTIKIGLGLLGIKTLEKM
jgi:arginyl-tRNA synthetase